MKPLRLTLVAFGPFATQEVIEFASAASAKLLLIHGPTGSGKTTILDAICFSLFGDTSGAERDGKQMRCDTSEAALKTLVRYDFSLGERRYCVERIPEQMRPALRGGGTTKENHQASLWDRSQTTSDTDEGKLLATGAKKVSLAVSKLLGFESEQFRQVVMLPQGQFRKLLTADSRDKEKILQRLFQTADYARLERVLSDKAKELRRGFQDRQVAMDTLLGQEDTDGLPGLELKLTAARVTQQENAALLPLKKTAYEVAQTALHTAKKQLECLRELAEAKAAKATLVAEASEFEELTHRCVLARKAIPLVARADALAQRTAEYKRLDLEVREVDAQRVICATHKMLTQTQLQEQETKEPLRQEANRKALHLETMTAAVLRLEEARETLAQASSTEAAASARQTKVETEAQVQRQGMQRLRSKHEESTATSAQVETLQMSLERGEALLTSRRRLGALCKEGEAAQNEHQKSEGALTLAVTEILGMQVKLEALEREWQAGQAGALARALVQGHACPVCGSGEHPQPAQPSEQLPSEQELETTRQGLGQCRLGRAGLQEAEAASRAKLSSLRASMAQLTEELGADAERSEPEWSLALAEARVRLKRALAARKKLQADSLLLAELQQKMEATDTSLGLLAKQAEDARVATATVAGSVEELESKVPAELRSPGALAMARAVNQEHIETLKAKLEQARRKAKQAAEAWAACDAKLTSAKSASVSALLIANETREDFFERSVNAGFSEEGSFAQAQATIVDLSRIESDVQTYRGQMQAARERLQRAETASRHVSPPKLEALSTQADNSRAELEGVIRLEAEHRSVLERLQRCHRDYQALAARVSKEEEEWQMVASVSELANGKVPPKVSFQRFVLGALLDEVLLAATERLSRMTRGRYQLLRQSELHHKGRASGLDLSVMDTYTGVPRAVHTLSGGESFLAALSLSLGLADVVQGFSGGIRLDTLFIDEGFGTLDSNALDLALDTLSELTAEGRLVAIISHVDELKNRISTRLEIVPSAEGSRSNFVGLT